MHCYITIALAVSMQIKINKEQTTCLEATPHAHELLLTKRALEAASGKTMLLDGGSGKKVLIPSTLSNYLRPSIDIDVIMPHNDALKAFSGMAKDKMVDKVKMLPVEGKLSYESVTYYSPFPVYRDSSYVDTDIFTTETGLGPISIVPNIFKEAITVNLLNSGMVVNVADIAFTIATSINPLVFTNTRARSSFVALFSNLDTFDVSDVAARSAEYLATSIERVNEVVSMAMSSSSRSHIKYDKNYRSYESILSEKTPNKLRMLDKKLEKIMSKVGIENVTVKNGINAFSSELAGIKKLLRS